jgi:hypothetical protein
MEQEYVRKKLAQYLTPGQVDAKLARSAERFTPSPAQVESEQLPHESPRTQIFSSAPAEISDDDLFE